MSRRPATRSQRLGAALELGELETAEGIVRVANQEMVRALRVVTVERGVDPRRFALMPFGGAGPMHAAALAEELGMERILCPRASGVLSALGLIASERRRDTARTVLLSGADLTAERIAAEVAELRESIGAGLAEAAPEATYELRYRGQAFELGDPGAAAPRPGRAGGAIRRRARAPLRLPGPRCARSSWSTCGWRWSSPRRRPQPEAAPAGRLERSARRARFGGAWTEAEVLRGEPEAGTDGRGAVRVRAAGGHPGPAAGLAERGGRAGNDLRGARAMRPGLDPVTLQVLVGALRAACEEMGAVLVRAAHSANIKERRDCSTALFDAAGELVMQAEHIPVHLGSMPDAVAAVLGEEHRPGDALDPQRPLPGRHPPARHHPDLARLRARRGLSLPCSASPPAAPITRTSAGRPRPGCRPARPGSRTRAW